MGPVQILSHPHERIVSWNLKLLRIIEVNPTRLPSGYVKIAIEHGPVEIVDLRMKIAWWIFPVRKL